MKKENMSSRKVVRLTRAAPDIMHSTKSSSIDLDKRVFTIPNLLSLIRIMLIPIIVWLYMYKKRADITLVLLLLSGITDTADGYIARRFNMVTDIGKVLDPIADKLTQFVVILCLAFRFTVMRWLVAALIIKELAIGVTGLVYFKKAGVVNSAKWHGKLVTWLLYAAIMAHIAFPDMAGCLSIAITGLCLFTMLLSFILYQSDYYFRLKQLAFEKHKPEIRLKPRIFILVLAVVLIAVLLRHLNISVEAIIAYTPKSAPLAVLVILLLYIFKSLTWLISLQILHLASGILFPFPIAVAVNVVGTAAAITLPYLIGRSRGRKYFDKLASRHPRLLRLASFSNRNPFLASLFVRGIGLTSLDPASIYFGASKAPYGMYMLGGMLGLLPTLLARTALGSSAKDTDSVWFILSIIAYALVLIGVAATGTVILAMARKHRRQDQALG